MRTKILEALRSGANFAGHYTIITTGCGTGCSSNLIANRRTGRVSEVPFGGEMQQQLNLQYRLNSPILTATWLNNDLCMRQAVVWNGTAFVVRSLPKGQPDSVCR